MRPWRVPCSPDKGFLKKRGMPARCWVSSCASLASFSCTTTSLLRYTSRHTWPSLLSPADHPVTSDGLSPLQTHVPLPQIPPRPPRDQQGNLVLQPGDCCLLILQRLCIKWWGGGFVCVSVCVRARSLSHACMHRRMWAHTAHAYTRRHTHSGPCPCWDKTQASGLSLARKKRRLSVESMGNPRPQAQ